MYVYIIPESIYLRNNRVSSFFVIYAHGYMHIVYCARLPKIYYIAVVANISWSQGAVC